MMELSIDTNNLHVISTDLANYYKIVPKEVSDQTILFYTLSNNVNSEIKDEIELLIGKTTQLIAVSENEINKALSIYYRKERTEKRNVFLHWNYNC